MLQPQNAAPKLLEDVLDREWLNHMLSERWPDARVAGFAVVETLVTQATKVRLSLDVSGGDSHLPAHICIKGILVDTGAPSSASIVETRFYRDSAEQLQVRVPRCIYAALNEAGDNGLIVMEDVIAGGGHFLSALEPFTPEQARQSVEQLAILHASTWQGQPLFEHDGVANFLDQITARPIIAADMLQKMLDGERGDRLPAAVRNAPRLQRGLEMLAAEVRKAPACLVHGDAHAGNVYHDAHGFGLVDWQIFQRGDWAQDIAYHFAAVLTPEDRGLHERSLLDYYRDRLASLGGPRIEADEGWTRYRAAMIYGYYLWAITRKVEPEITNEFVRRLGVAVGELESFALVGA